MTPTVHTKTTPRDAILTAKDVIGTHRDAYFVLERIYHDNGSYVSILVAPSGKRGSCQVEVSLVEQVGFDSWATTRSIHAGPFPLTTTLDTLISIGKKCVPTLSARARRTATTSL